ncbi:MAG: outer membrane protein assembly factor BamA [Sulfurospirillum sp.]|nr:outer membrane protein assembly factor BamA [Sulfurospirillum sp.]
MNKILLAFFVTISVSFASQIKSLEFDGLVRLSHEAASQMIGISVGDIVDIEKIDQAIKLLYKQNYFTDIWVEDAGNGKMIFHFKEKPAIANIQIDGIGENDKEEILSITSIKKGEIYDAQKSDLAKANIIKHFEMKGYFDTVVEVEKEELSKDAFSLRFIINRGEEIFIDTVNLCGAQNLDYGDVEPMMANKSAEFLPWMWGFNDGKLRLADLEFDAQRIKDVYMQNGYLDVVVSTPFLKAYMDSYRANLSYNITEGIQYKIGKITLAYPNELIPQEELFDAMVLKEGQIFNIKRLRKDIQSVQNKIADLGYAYAKVLPNIQNDKQTGLSNIELKIITGDKVYINDVRISGNTRTIDRVARREVYLAHGDLYSKTDLDDSISALKRTSYFENVYIEEQRIANDKIDLVIHVSEASTGSIGGGIGYGSSDGLLLNANVSDSNIFGSGLRAVVDLERSDKQLTGRVSLSNPRVFDSIYSLSGSLYAEDNDYLDYDEKKLGFNLTVGRKIGRYTSASLGYVLEDVKYSAFSDFWTNFYPNGYSALKSSIIPAISFNNTDDYYLPRKGFATSAAIEVAGLGGDQKFTKTTTKFSYFYGLEDLIDYDLILRYRARAQYITDNGELPPGEKLYMGGISTVRGYESSSLSPKDSNGDLLGGRMLFANSVEASFPLIERLKMRGALFLDYGMIGEDDLSVKRAGTGFNLEWVSPLGPILLIFSKPLLKESGDRTATFEFTMGRQF